VGEVQQLQPPVTTGFWPELSETINSVSSPGFNEYLDRVEEIMNTKPSIKGATMTFNLEQIERDERFIEQQLVSNSGDLDETMRLLIEQHQQLGADMRLQGDHLEVFQQCDQYPHLCKLATEGAVPVIRESFVPNAGYGEPLRPQYQQLKPAVHHQVAKWVAAHRGFLVPKRLLMGYRRLHVSSPHIVEKKGDVKGRFCIDVKASLLNEATMLEEVYEELGELHLPVLREIAALTEKARRRGETILSKFDVEAAFHRFKLNWLACLLLAIDLDDYFFIPVVGMFGWSPCPAHYNTISKTVEWAHRGGLSCETIDWMRSELGMTPIVRKPEWCTPERLARRSTTYVDDSSLISMPDSFGMDAADLITIVSWLLGKTAIKEEKTEGPTHCLEITGWKVDMLSGTFAPSQKGVCKLLYYLFRVTGSTERSIPLDVLESMLGVLQHYSAVLPLVYGALGHLRGQLIAAKEAAFQPRRINLNAQSLQELTFWRGMMEACLRDRTLYECPMSFLQKRDSEDMSITMFSDASYTIGGGYVINGVGYSYWQWTDDERVVFEEINQHINVLELMVVVVAVWSNVALFRNRSVRVFVDNTSAISWIKAMRSNSPLAKPWIRLLVLLCITFNIHLSPTHIPGVLNVIADGLSRDIQEIIQSLSRSGLRCIEPMTLDCRMQLFVRSSGSDALSAQWAKVLEVLMAQGVVPLRSSVTSIIAILASRKTL
jgi:hypothetical protein